MMTQLPQKPVVDALAAEFQALDGLTSGLAAADWTASSPCPGWDVRANLAHIVGTESMLAGVASPDVPVDPATAAHVHNEIGATNERWILHLASLSTDELVARFRTITAGRIAALRAMSAEEWSREGWTPAGTDTYGRFMRLRIFDCWMHEQDIRDAIARPGHEDGPAVELALDEMIAALGYVVGKRAGAPRGSTVALALTGPAGRTVHVEVADRAAVVDELDGPPTVTLRMPVGVFTRLAGGRVRAADVAEQIEVTGDQALGEAILTNIAYTM